MVPPTLTGIAPNGARAGRPAMVVRANGSDFLNGAVVHWTSPAGYVSSLSTTFQNAARLDAGVPASYLTTVGTAQVAVVNPNGSVANSQPFSIVP